MARNLWEFRVFQPAFIFSKSKVETHFSGASIADFGQLNPSWNIKALLLLNVSIINFEHIQLIDIMACVDEFEHL